MQADFRGYLWLAISIFLALPLLSQERAWGQASAPRLRSVPSGYNLGNVSRSKGVLRIDFQIKNEGGSSLEIIKIQPS